MEEEMAREEEKDNVQGETFEDVEPKLKKKMKKLKKKKRKKKRKKIVA